MNVQVYLFIILYSYWIATNIIQYLLYLVVLVYEYHSAISDTMGSAIVSNNYATFLWKYKDLSWGQEYTPILRHGSSAVMTPCFCNCQSDLIAIVWCTQIRLTPSFSRKNHFVSITLSSRDMWT